MQNEILVHLFRNNGNFFSDDGGSTEDCLTPLQAETSVKSASEHQYEEEGGRLQVDAAPEICHDLSTEEDGKCMTEPSVESVSEQLEEEVRSGGSPQVEKEPSISDQLNEISHDAGSNPSTEEDRKCVTETSVKSVSEQLEEFHKYEEGMRGTKVGEEQAAPGVDKKTSAQLEAFHQCEQEMREVKVGEDPPVSKQVSALSPRTIPAPPRPPPGPPPREVTARFVPPPPPPKQYVQAPNARRATVEAEQEQAARTSVEEAVQIEIEVEVGEKWGIKGNQGNEILHWCFENNLCPLEALNNAKLSETLILRKYRYFDEIMSLAGLYNMTIFFLNPNYGI